MLYGAAIRSDGKAFLMISSGGAPAAVYVTTVADLLAEGVSSVKAGSPMSGFVPISGYSFGGLYDESEGILWVMNGTHLQVFGGDGALLRDISPAELGGKNIYSIALVNDYDGETPNVPGGGSSGGGCNTGAGWLALLLAASLLFKKRHAWRWE
jgi:Synergist-CTERM protein sorting domain-containing protein